jgi:hypothetical protein
MTEERYAEDPEHKHQDDQVFGKTASARQEQVDRQLEEADGDASVVDDQEVDGRAEPHAGGRADG